MRRAWGRGCAWPRYSSRILRASAIHSSERKRYFATARTVAGVKRRFAGRPGHRRTGTAYDRQVAGSISRDDVAHVARLARLDVTDDELERFTEQLAAVLDHASDVAALDLEGVPP